MIAGPQNDECFIFFRELTPRCLSIALEEDGVDIPRNSGALLCGMKGMTESVKDILTKAGVFEGRVLFNF